MSAPLARRKLSFQISKMISSHSFLQHLGMQESCPKRYVQLSHSLRANNTVGPTAGTYIHGIEENEIQPTDHSSIMLLLEAERKKSEELISRVQHLEQENAELKCAALQPTVLDSQLQQLMNPIHSVYHGPDTVAHTYQPLRY